MHATLSQRKAVRRRYYASKDRYWAYIEQFRQTSFPEWTYDFISIHRHGDSYSLLAPLKWCYARRPKFESRKFATFNEAKIFALRIANASGRRRAKAHVVSCV